MRPPKFNKRMGSSLDQPIHIDLLPPPNGEGLSYEVFCKDLRPSLDWSPSYGWRVPSPMVGTWWNVSKFDLEDGLGIEVSLRNRAILAQWTKAPFKVKGMWLIDVKKVKTKQLLQIQRHYKVISLGRAIVEPYFPVRETGHVRIRSRWGDM
ncbi:hypothetical protein CK203_037093 [Vitis vinifera]|uniref:Uncharacterized protein n=1 Tax=Vitis vinifera TaxID=29760 RepID=A0A438I5R4_VITVI|nr:hypothetical protein CK203_037093 [Vitis vinifera]